MTGEPGGHSPGDTKRALTLEPPVLSSEGSTAPSLHLGRAGTGPSFTPSWAELGLSSARPGATVVHWPRVTAPEDPTGLRLIASSLASGKWGAWPVIKRVWPPLWR